MKFYFHLARARVYVRVGQSDQIRENSDIWELIIIQVFLKRFT